MKYQLEQLSKSELLGLIYHHVNNGNILSSGHPVFCASCGDGVINSLQTGPGKVYESLGYICDRCNEIE